MAYMAAPTASAEIWKPHDRGGGPSLKSCCGVSPLSATIIASSCAESDAWATACMVLGTGSAIMVTVVWLIKNAKVKMEVDSLVIVYVRIDQQDAVYGCGTFRGGFTPVYICTGDFVEEAGAAFEAFEMEQVCVADAEGVGGAA